MMGLVVPHSVSQHQNQFTMKLFIVLFAVVAAAAAYPGWSHEASSGWQDPWQNNGWQNNGWQNKGWQQNSGWQNPWQQNKWQGGWQGGSHGGWQNQWQPQHSHHQPHHIDVLQVAAQPPIPPIHPKPVHLKTNDHVTRIHYDHAHIPHPHLIGVEHEVHEPEIKHVVKSVHGHGW